MYLPNSDERESAQFGVINTEACCFLCHVSYRFPMPETASIDTTSISRVCVLSIFIAQLRIYLPTVHMYIYRHTHIYMSATLAPGYCSERSFKAEPPAM